MSYFVAVIEVEFTQIFFLKKSWMLIAMYDPIKFDIWVNHALRTEFWGQSQFTTLNFKIYTLPSMKTSQP